MINVSQHSNDLIGVRDTPPSLPNANFYIFETIGTLCIPLIGIILTIILLVKSIKSRKNILNEMSSNSIDKVKRTSIILLVLSIISCSFITIILSIISIVLTSSAKKIFSGNVEDSKSKISTASILNIISIVLVAITYTILILAIFMGGMTILSVVNSYSLI